MQLGGVPVSVLINPATCRLEEASREGETNFATLLI